uniref:ER lumen protein-retaining receptor n=2 Tax=Pseudo-nitzschia australis TaxID=44445 RepID=A0A7S4EEV5_9STRA|mmetsp:Transcript_7202/g.15373  ORF Transcript_7202/g.15373 Transcript_7202/m.15373 type:complete len:369 (-) Transcript_7202:106-1212(-)|eukprot:CAMPEP_0168169968 /NCGR_PEP_ID=MMETSP0139_2-20121125/3919_1 /TAXON_ID=44445 /ORGANISM="Pseudo-nitzschia australis, Strain 10249 10 AB" /LENGTH=368 /DNA_ID=CAMNT_0008087419 /DNA_START=142 /DNA_END=1248 /DNA_ORIENTATION=-
MSDGPYGRHGFSANAGAGYGGQSAGASYGSQQGGGYAAPSYGQSYGGGASYGASGGQDYSAQYGSYGGGAPDNYAAGSDNDDGKNRGKKSIAVQALNMYVLMWAGFISASLLVYFMLSGGDFSFLMTYGGMARMFGFGILNLKTFKSQRATGVSIKTLQLYCCVFFFRLTSIIRHEGYLPYDKSGDWLYHFVEGMSLLMCVLALYACTVPFKHTYQADLDKFGELMVPTGAGAVYLALPILVLAILVHPNLNADFLSDTAWTYAMYLESAALLPQLYMFQKQSSGVVELLTAHFVFALGFGRVMEFLFWIYSYHELADASGSKLPGYLALFSQAVQLLMMLDFFWYYYLAVKNATPLVLPSHGGAGIV